MESAEPSGRFDFSEDNDSRIPSEDDGEKKKIAGKKGKNVGFPKMLRFWGRKNDSEEKEVLSELQVLSELEVVGIRRYDYMVLHRATDSFRCLIGKGGSSYVYKGILEDYQEVAIKVKSQMIDIDRARGQCMTEIKVLSEMRHRNVVQLLGWCLEVGGMALVLEFMPNGSLADHLHGRNKDLPCLPWEVRYRKIAMGMASALQYLQDGLKECVVHRDINPSNILLDIDFNPKLADFGLAEVASQLRAELLDFPTTCVVGTIGYLDPQYAMTGKPSKASDIYGFGMVALEIATGKKPIVYRNGDSEHLVRWVDDLYEAGRILEAVDPNLGDEFDEREVERLLLVGLWCTRLDDKSRPPIKLILQLLNFEVPMPSYLFSKQGHGAPPEFSQEPNDVFSVEVEIDATTTKSTTDSDTFEDTEAGDGQSFELVRYDQQEDDAFSPASSPELTLFDIGIPPDHFGLSTSGMENHRTMDHHRNVLNAFVHSLQEMVRSEEHLPRFDDALLKIKTFTTALVMMGGPPLDDWNALAQRVLRYLKERDEFFKSYGDDAPLADTAITLLSLDEGMRRCARTIKEDRERLKDYEERRARAHRRCSSLEAELAEARRTLSSIEDEITALEARIAQSLSSLQKRRRHCAILKQHHHLLSEISSFTC